MVIISSSIVTDVQLCSALSIQILQTSSYYFLFHYFAAVCAFVKGI